MHEGKVSWQLELRDLRVAHRNRAAQRDLGCMEMAVLGNMKGASQGHMESTMQGRTKSTKARLHEEIARAWLREEIQSHIQACMKKRQARRGWMTDACCCLVFVAC
eukprot:scaffold43428_cov14-Tisochrysis_lutea.AAC.1